MNYRLFLYILGLVAMSLTAVCCVLDPDGEDTDSETTDADDTDSELEFLVPPFGSCTEMSLEPGQCLELEGSGYSDTDSQTALEAESFCGYVQGTYHAETGCPQEDLIAVCFGVNGGETSEFDVFYYTPNYNVDQAQDDCTSGDFVEMN